MVVTRLFISMVQPQISESVPYYPRMFHQLRGVNKICISCHNTSSNYDDVTIADSKMVITNPGNVGIGTATPYAKLQVQGGGGFNFKRDAVVF